MIQNFMKEVWRKQFSLQMEN